MAVITVHNAKGGVGKTVTTIVLSTLLGPRTRVLAVDLDPIGSLTLACGITARQFQSLNVEKCFLENADPASFIHEPEGFGFHLLPASPRLSLVAQGSARQTLREVLGRLRISYDVVLVDTQPTESALTRMALSAADFLLIPCITDFYSIRALAIAYRRLQQDIVNINPQLRVLGVLPTQYRARTKLADEALRVLQQLCSVMSVNMFTDPIPYSVRYAETGQKPVSVKELTKDPKILGPYERLAEWIATSLQLPMRGGVAVGG